MLKSYQYRIYPTKAQETILENQLEECRWLYNHFIEVRKKTYEETGKSLTMFAQQKTLPELKALRPSLESIHSQVLQNVATRVDLAYKAFFRRLKDGEKPGYPRFKGKYRYHSMTFTQSGFSLKEKVLTLSKVEDIKIILHRPRLGTVKTCNIKRSSTGKWYVTFVTEINIVCKNIPTEQVGIDVGISSFATLSTGEPIENPKFFKTDEKELGKAQRKFSKTEKGSPERKKRRKPVARIHERIKFRRHNFAHQLSKRIVKKYGFIAVEDLEVNRMIKNPLFSKSISDAAWSLFFTILAVKAANAERKFVKVDPSYTSQTCNACGYRQKMPLSVRTFSCENCKVVRDRDHNASLNILALGLQSMGNQSLEAPTNYLVGE